LQLLIKGVENADALHYAIPRLEFYLGVKPFPGGSLTARQITGSEEELMFSKKLAALVATSLVVATSPAIAQSNPASKLSPVARAGAPVAEASAMGTPGDDRYAGGFWVALIGAALVAALVLIVIDDEDDLPESP
jgi:hypothetical protein